MIKSFLKKKFDKKRLIRNLKISTGESVQRLRYCLACGQPGPIPNTRVSPGGIHDSRGGVNTEPSQVRPQKEKYKNK